MKKYVAFLIVISMILSLGAVNVGAADYNVFYDFNVAGDMSMIELNDIAGNSGVTRSWDSEEGAMKVTATTASAKYQKLWVDIVGHAAINNELVSISFKVKRQASGTGFELRLGGHNVSGGGWSDDVVRIDSSGDWQYLPDYSDGTVLGNGQDSIGQWAKFTVEFDTRNRRCKIYKNDIEVEYYNKWNNTSSKQNDGKYIVTDLYDLDSLYFAFGSATEGVEAVGYIDDIRIISGAKALKEDAENADTDAKKQIIYDKIDYYVDECGYERSDFADALGALKSVSSKEYSFDYVENKITGVPFETEYSDFLDNITAKSGVSLLILREGEEITDGFIQNGDILVAGDEEYRIEVMPASTDNTITSYIYEVTGNKITGVTYGTYFGTFLKNISIDEYASLSYTVYEEDYDGIIDSDFTVTVTAQAGNKKTYTVEYTELDDYDVELYSDLFDIDNQNNVITLSEDMGINAFSEAVTAGDGEEIKLMDKYFNEKVSGKITGSEFVRVKKNGSAFTRYEDYKILLKKSDVLDMHIKHEDVTREGTFWDNDLEGMGYGTTINSNVGNPVITFPYTPAADGELTVYLHSTPHSQGGFARGIAYHNGGKTTAIPAFDCKSPTGFYNIGKFDVKAGDETKITISGYNDLLQIGGIRFSLEKTSEVIKSVTIDGENIESVQWLNDLKPQFDISIGDDYSPSADIESKIKLISQNGYKTNIKATINGNVVSVVPESPLKNGTGYNLVIEENAVCDAKQKGYNGEFLYRLKTEGTGFSASVVLKYFNEEDIRVNGKEDAKYFSVAYKANNLTDNANMVVGVYEDNKLIKMVSEKASEKGEIFVDAGKKLKKNSVIKVFAEDDSETPMWIMTEPCPQMVPGAASSKIYAADSIIDENGNYLSDEGGELRIAFIGGSITAGDSDFVGTGLSENSIWVNRVSSYFKEQFPNKAIKTYNAGLGGTDSSYGAIRFNNHVMQYAPDIVFVEFTVNDGGNPSDKSYQQRYVEQMIRMCKKARKEPVFIYVHVQRPIDETDSFYDDHLQCIEWKNELTAHYGIKTIDLQEAFEDDFQNNADGNTTFMSYISKYFNSNGVNSYDVHPKIEGHKLMADSIIDAIESDKKGTFKKIEDAGIFSVGFTEPEYNFITVDDRRITYSDGFTKYTRENPYVHTLEGGMIPIDQYKYPSFPGGILQTEEDGAEISFQTKATSVALSYISSTVGNSAKVYVDDKEVGSFSCYSPYYGMNYLTNFVKIAEDGKMHKVRIVVDDVGENNYLFRFGAIVECFE